MKLLTALLFCFKMDNTRRVRSVPRSAPLLRRWALGHSPRGRSAQALALHRLRAECSRQLGQFRDVHRDPARLIPREVLHRHPAAGLVLVVDVEQRREVGLASDRRASSGSSPARKIGTRVPGMRAGNCSRSAQDARGRSRREARLQTSWASKFERPASSISELLGGQGFVYKILQNSVI
jgi:hypothetical protein